MAITFNKLWHLLIDRGMTKEDLRIAAKLSPTTIATMGRNEGVSFKTVEKICITLGVQPGDIMEIEKPKEG